MELFITSDERDTVRVSMHSTSANANSFVLSAHKSRFFIDSDSAYGSTWEFIDENGNVYKQSVIKYAESKKYDAPDGWAVIASDAKSAYGEHFKRAERIIVTAFPHVMFIIDRIETDIPVKMISHFAVNNRDGMTNINVAADNKLVIRRGEGAMKFFTFPYDKELEMSRQYGRYSENAEQGEEGSVLIFDYTSCGFKTSHTIIHPFAITPLEEIKKWHIKPENDNTFFTVSSYRDEEQWQIRLSGDSIEMEKIK